VGSTKGPVLVGRTEELERLRVCCASLANGSGALVLLDGEAGAGKTRLVGEVVKPPFLPRGCVSVIAAALDYAPAPYAPIRDLLVALDRQFPKVLARNSELAAALRPILEFRPIDESGEYSVERRRLLDAAVQALSLFAAASPLVLAIEDVHWIDRASADVLLHVARSVNAMRAMMVVSYRGVEMSGHTEARDLVAQLSRNATMALSLKRLSVADSLLLIDEIAPPSMPMSLRRTICDLAQGNPLLLVELAQQGAENAALLRGSLPVSLQAVVSERLAGFDETDRDILRVCAAMGTFDPRIVAEIAQAPLDRVLLALRKARAASIVSESTDPYGGFVFRHALIRRAITDQMLGIELAALHSRIAHRLQQEPDSPPLYAKLAYHYWMAREVEPAERYNVLAGDQATAVYAFSDAVTLYERGLLDRLLDSNTVDLYRKLAGACEQANRHVDALELYRRLFLYAQEHQTAREAANAALEISRCCFQTLDDDGCISSVRDALAIVPEGDASLRFDLYALLAWYVVHLRRLEEGREALTAAAELYEYGSALSRVRYHEARAAYEVHAHGGGEWREEIEAVLEHSAGLDAATRLRRYGNAISLAVASEIDDYAYAFVLCQEAREIIEEHREVDPVPFFSTAARILLALGKVEVAREWIERLLPYVNDAPIYGFRAAYAGIPVALHLGDERLLRACGRPRLLEEVFNAKDPVVYGPVAAAVAEQFLQQGRAGEAVALAERTISKLQDAGNNIDLLMVVARVGSAAAVEHARELLEPWVERSRSARAAMSFIRAYQCKGEERVEWARKAAAEFAEIPWPLQQARSLELAEDWDAALSIYTACGASADVQRLERQSARVEQIADVLSKREREVAQLVAEGNSNRAIAEKLVLSERTVENHIASIFNKLNMRSRAEIATYIARASSGAV
jgi:DNA-binding CsgD family transcriptional regulator